MQHNAAFHLGLHWLQMFSFRGFLNTKCKWNFCLIMPIKDNEYYLFIIHTANGIHQNITATAEDKLKLTSVHALISEHRPLL